MPLLALLAVVLLGTELFTPDNERLLTAGLQFITIVMVWLHTHRVRRTIEPQVEQTAAVVARVVGEREPTGEHEPWNGVERRGRGRDQS